MASVRMALFAVAAAIAATCVAEAATTRVAVIAIEGESTLADFVAPSIEAGLSKEAAVTLVERTLIKKVLSEQQLAAAGLMEPSKAIQVGRILGVDIFLVIDAPPPPPPAVAQAGLSTPPTCRIRAVEARTGIMLCSCFAPQEALKTDISSVTSLIQLANRKLSYPPNSRRYVALLAFRSEALDRSLDSLADTLAMFLLNDLANSPNVVVLEREQLDRLVAEKALAGADVELRTSAVLLKGGLAYGATRDELVATIGLQSLKGEKEEYLHINGSTKNLAGLRAQAGRAVGEKLKAEPSSLAPISPKLEAEIFMNRAHTECGFGPNGVIPLVEASVALDPSTETLERAKQSYLRVAQWYTIVFSTPGNSQEVVEHAAIVGLQALVRFQEAQYLLFRSNVLSPWEKEHFAAGDSLWLPLTQLLFLDAYATAVRDTRSSQARALQLELAELYLRQYRESLSIAAETWRKTGEAKAWWILVNECLTRSHDLAASDEEWLAIVQEAVGQIEKPPVKVATNPALAPNYKPLIWEMSHCFPQLTSPPQPRIDPAHHRVIPAPSDPKEVYPGVRRVYDWLTSHPDPLVRLSACAAACQRGWGCSRDAERGLQILAGELTPVLPDGTENAYAREDRWVNHAWDGLFFWTYNHDPELMIKYGEAILRPMLGREHARLAVTWRITISRWLSSLEEAYRFQEAYAISKEFQEAVGAFSPPDLAAQANAKRHVDLLEIKLGIMPPPPSPNPPPPDLRVEGFVVQRILTDYDYALRDMQPDGDRLFILELGFRDSNSGRVRLVAIPVQGGERSIIGEIMLKGMGDRALSCAAVLTRDETGHWLASLSGLGIVTFGEGRTRLWTETDGLPSLQVTSFASLNGRWYLGMSAGGIIEFDPQTGRFATLCSCRSQAPQNVFDGPPKYEVPFILSDPLRHCLWVFVTNTQGHETRRGMWKFDVVSRKFSFASGNLPHVEFGGARWCFNRILLKGLGLYDPATDRLYYLTEHAYARPPEDPWPRGTDGALDYSHPLPKNDPWPRGTYDEYWPVGLFGDKIVGKRDLFTNWVTVVLFGGDAPIQLPIFAKEKGFDFNLGLAAECGDAVVVAGGNSSAVCAIRDKEGPPSFKRLEAMVPKAPPEPTAKPPRHPAIDPRTLPAYRSPLLAFLSDPRILRTIVVGVTAFSGLAVMHVVRARQRKRKGSPKV